MKPSRHAAGELSVDPLEYWGDAISPRAFARARAERDAQATPAPAPAFTPVPVADGVHFGPLPRRTRGDDSVTFV